MYTPCRGSRPASLPYPTLPTTKLHQYPQRPRGSASKILTQDLVHLNERGVCRHRRYTLSGGGRPASLPPSHRYTTPASPWIVTRCGSGYSSTPKALVVARHFSPAVCLLLLVTLVKQLPYHAGASKRILRREGIVSLPEEARRGNASIIYARGHHLSHRGRGTKTGTGAGILPSWLFVCKSLSTTVHTYAPP